MRSLSWILFLASARLPAPASGGEPAGKTPADSAYVLLTEGIVGGIVAARVRLQLVVVPAADGHLVALMDASRPGDEPAYQIGRVSAKRVEALLRALESGGLWSLPVESPVGSEDIYRLDTSLAVGARDRTWRNAAPEGCVHGTSEVRPSAKEAERFRKCVAAVLDLRSLAVTQSDEAVFRSCRDEFERHFAGERGQGKGSR